MFRIIVLPPFFPAQNLFSVSPPDSLGVNIHFCFVVGEAKVHCVFSEPDSGALLFAPDEGTLCAQALGGILRAAHIHLLPAALADFGTLMFEFPVCKGVFTATAVAPNLLSRNVLANAAGQHNELLCVGCPEIHRIVALGQNLLFQVSFGRFRQFFEPLFRFLSLLGVSLVQPLACTRRKCAIHNSHQIFPVVVKIVMQAFGIFARC